MIDEWLHEEAKKEVIRTIKAEIEKAEIEESNTSVKGAKEYHNKKQYIYLGILQYIDRIV